MQKRQLLSVDFNENTHKTLAEAAASFEIEVISAYSGAEGIEIFWKNQDIILLATAIHLPVIDGLEMIKRLRRLGLKSPTLAVVDSGDREALERASKLALTGWLQRPLTIATSRECFRRVLGIESPTDDLNHDEKKTKKKIQQIGWTFDN